MNVNPLVFSNKPRYRITRHVLFWSSWILYYTYFDTLIWGNKFPFVKVFLASLLEQVISTPMDMAFCYAIIYFLIPRYLQKGSYIPMVLLWLLFSVLYVACFRFYTIDILPSIRSVDGLPTNTLHYYSFAWSFFDYFSQINMEGCIAASIKLGKMWYIKQQELNLIKSEKLKSEPQIQDEQMQPFFLINALDKIGLLSSEKPSLIPGMLKKIKSLLMYVIYDNNQARVRLERELRFLEEYVDLEIAGSEEKVKVTMNIKGNMAGEHIAPFIILPLVQNSFRQLSLLDLANKFIDIDIHLSEGRLFIKVAWSKPVDSSTLVNGGNTSLQNIGNRLSLLYPQSHELKIIIKTHQFIINCRIDLHGAIN